MKNHNQRPLKKSPKKIKKKKDCNSCDYCHKKTNKLIKCQYCDQKVHFKCLSYKIKKKVNYKKFLIYCKKCKKRYRDRRERKKKGVWITVQDVPDKNLTIRLQKHHN